MKSTGRTSKPFLFGEDYTERNGWEERGAGPSLKSFRREVIRKKRNNGIRGPGVNGKGEAGETEREVPEPVVVEVVEVLVWRRWSVEKGKSSRL